MGADEAASWMAFERLYGPLGQERDDWLAAQIEAAIYNSQRVSGEPVTVQDCKLFGPRPKPPTQSVDDMMRVVRMAGAGRKKKRDKNGKRRGRKG